MSPLMGEETRRADFVSSVISHERQKRRFFEKEEISRRQFSMGFSL